MSKKVLITGAASGIGLATSTLLSQLGFSVLGLDRTESDTKFPGELHLIDLLNKKPTSKLLNDLIDDNTYAVVNNVGMNSPQSIDEVDFETFQKTIDLNLWVAIESSQILVKRLKMKNNPGRIVNIGSTSIKGVKNRSVYSASKGALQSLTRTLAIELAPFNITVNLVSPGAIDTPLYNQINPPGSASRVGFESNIPLKRAGKPEEIAYAVSYFLSEHAAYTTAQNLYVDGGLGSGIKI